MNPGRWPLWTTVGAALLVADGSAMAQGYAEPLAVWGVMLGLWCLYIGWLLYQGERGDR